MQILLAEFVLGYLSILFIFSMDIHLFQFCLFCLFEHIWVFQAKTTKMNNLNINTNKEQQTERYSFMYHEMYERITQIIISHKTKNLKFETVVTFRTPHKN